MEVADRPHIHFLVKIMPVNTGKDKDGCYAKWGQEGKKYYYPCDNETKKNKAKKLAYIQGIAISNSGGDK